VTVESVRRVMVVGPQGYDIARVRQLLAGRELRRKGEEEPVGLLALLPNSEKTVQRYVRAAHIWSTVTPVMLPGYDDPDGLRRKLRQRPTASEQKRLLERLDRRIRSLLREAFLQAGWPRELIDHQETVMEYREVGFRAGVDLSRRYNLPPLKFPRYHVRATFPHLVQGPLAVGAGRYRGLGLFASEAGAVG
jgi:CRISPR-associated protein Csb2